MHVVRVAAVLLAAAALLAAGGGAYRATLAAPATADGGAAGHCGRPRQPDAAGRLGSIRATWAGHRQLRSGEGRQRLPGTRGAPNGPGPLDADRTRCRQGAREQSGHRRQTHCAPPIRGRHRSARQGVRLGRRCATDRARQPDDRSSERARHRLRRAGRARSDAKRALRRRLQRRARPPRRRRQARDHACPPAAGDRRGRLAA